MRLSKICRCIGSVTCALCVAATAAAEAMGKDHTSHPHSIDATISVLTALTSASGTGTVTGSFSHVTHLSGKVAVLYGERDYIPVDRRSPDIPLVITSVAPSTANLGTSKLTFVLDENDKAWILE